jgi:cellulose synthase/poly-beta-1,6-N-acetylglucosamine synthase-like glycosyltransferase
MPKVNLIITAWKEPLTTAKIIETVVCFLRQIELRIILVCPDSETGDSALSAAKNSEYKGLVVLKDSQKGKPTALNLAFEYILENNLDSDFIVCTDGDIVLEKDSVNNLVDNLTPKKYIGVTSRPRSVDSKDNFWGYVGNMLADAAHAKRKSDYESGKFIIMSGYLLGFDSTFLEDVRIPENCLVDDAYISLRLQEIFDKEKMDYQNPIGYCENSIVGIKYPTNYRDWISQKTRSVGGYRQLKNFFPRMSEQNKSRIWEELRWMIYPLRYCQNESEFFYSLFFYPLRLDLWLRIIWNSFFGPKNIDKAWTRIESTK